ncbi:MAG: patatin-like phospholipase family protein, partial [Actinomycetes bacterium]
GVVVDRFSGVSMGAVVASLLAEGRSAQAADAAIYEEFVRRNPTNDYTVPAHALIRGRKTEAGLQRWFDLYMEELPKGLVLASTDLLNRQLVLHRRGHLGTAIRASLSLPALFPPVRLGDTLHVDGGVLDNLPIEPLVAHGEGPVIAVNISAGSTGRSTGRPRIPALGDTLLRSLLMTGAMKIDQYRDQAAIVVTPDTRGIGLLEFHQLDRLRESGRIAGRAVVEALQSLPGGVEALPSPRPALDADVAAAAEALS